MLNKWNFHENVAARPIEPGTFEIPLKRKKFGMWVYAHWDKEIVHTCNSCGREHSIVCGVVALEVSA